MLAELDREDKDGFNLAESQDDDFDMDASLDSKKQTDSKKLGGHLGAMKLDGGISKETGSDANYDDDFDDDIPEDLPEDKIDYDADLNARSNNLGGSGAGITVSQSLGVDPSVDSMALEDYDHVEPVERIA